VTDNELDLPGRTLPAPSHISQSTVVEQTRAAAEVIAQVTAARDLPRDVQAARAAIVDACQLDEFAAAAFFRYPRGGSTVTGPSIYLARALAGAWGNFDYGIKELARDDTTGRSEMLAFAWDMQTNTRNSIGFFVPHMRDRKSGPEPLIDLRDIYENNANMGARRLRAAIFAVLPPWYTQLAQATCRATIRDGGGKPLQERVAAMLSKFRALQVTEDDITRKVGRPASKWTTDDLADLTVTYTSLQRGEVTRGDEFPPDTPPPVDDTTPTPRDHQDKP
jgi:hypothetical protein